MYDLRDLELCYAPPFSNPKDAGNQAGLVACNLLEGAFRQVRVQEVRGLVEAGACIIRRAGGGRSTPAPTSRPAVNIPLSQLRRRLEEIPRDRPVYLHCRSAQRSYKRLPLPAGPRLFQCVQHLRQLFGAVPVRVLQRRDPGPGAHCHRV